MPPSPQRRPPPRPALRVLRFPSQPTPASNKRITDTARKLAQLERLDPRSAATIGKMIDNLIREFTSMEGGR